MFVEFRKKLGIDQINGINEKILGLTNNHLVQQTENTNEPIDRNQKPESDASEKQENIPEKSTIKNDGQLITDNTTCPQDIAYPSDLNLLNDAREKSVNFIDLLYTPHLHKRKPRTYRKVAEKTISGQLRKRLNRKEKYTMP